MAKDILATDKLGDFGRYGAGRGCLAKKDFGMAGES